MRGHVRAFMVVSLLAVAACGGDDAGDDASSAATETDASDVAPFHEVPADAVGVTGTATCGFSDGGTNADGEPGMRVDCELDMSDPRVSGAEIHDGFRTIETPEAAAGMWLVEDATLTNDQGSWSGTAQAADDGLPCGEAHYVGEDGYDGLEFHYYFCHVDAGIVLRGWISGG
jgi:hypothetical protein